MSQTKDKNKESNMISVMLVNNESKKIPLSSLDAYSLKKYKTFYEESKPKVRADIKNLSVKYKTNVPKDIVALLFGEMLPTKEKKLYVDKHESDLTKIKKQNEIKKGKINE